MLNFLIAFPAIGYFLLVKKIKKEIHCMYTLCVCVRLRVPARENPVKCRSCRVHSKGAQRRKAMQKKMMVRSGFTFTYLSTAEVVWATQMISQPVSSHFSLFSIALWDLANSSPVFSPNRFAVVFDSITVTCIIDILLTVYGGVLVCGQ